MIAAEKWHEYQADYKRYGFDMKPEPVVVVKPAIKAEGSILKARDKLRLLVLLSLTGALLISLIIVTAYGAKLQYNTNQTLSQADQIQRQIDNINVSIRTACNVETIEGRATGELGMTYPDAASLAYVEIPGEEDQNLAGSLKEIAFSGQ